MKNYITKPNKKKVVMVRANRLDQEIRLPKVIDVLKKAGYNIKIINWDRESLKTSSDDFNEYEQFQLKFKAPDGIKMIFLLPIWWIYIFFNLLRLDWDIVHCVNSFNVIPAIIAAKLKNKLLIYELLDIVELSDTLPSKIRPYFLKFDKIIMKHSDGIIVADEMQIIGLEGIPNKNVYSIYDSPPYNNKIHSNFKSESASKFRIFHAGELNKVRKLNIDKLILAIKDLDGIELTIAGSGDLVPDIKKWESDFSDKIKFIGRISYEEVMENGLQSDLFFVFRDSEILSNKYNCGSTIFNAMICGKPLLANKNSSTANMVEKENCGLVVDAYNIDEIKSSIIKLKNNPELAKVLGENGQNAYKTDYSWEKMSKLILKLYKTIQI